MPAIAKENAAMRYGSALSLSVTVAAVLTGCSGSTPPPLPADASSDQALAWISKRIEDNCSQLGYKKGTDSHDQRYWHLASYVRSSLSGQSVSDLDFLAPPRNPSRPPIIEPYLVDTFAQQEYADDQLAREWQAVAEPGSPQE
jgi:hypothetical protein